MVLTLSLNTHLKGGSSSSIYRICTSKLDHTRFCYITIPKLKIIQIAVNE